MSIVKTPFAIKDGNIIHISELKKEKKDFDYKCYCCSCKEKLIPRLGSTNSWHFAHKDSNCVAALETGLHIMAKRILNEKKEMILPKLSILTNEYYYERGDFHYNSIDEVELTETILYHDKHYNHIYETYEYEEIHICKSKKYLFDSVDVEKQLGDIIPDIILYKNNKPLLVEIAVTHFIDSEKMNKIKEKKLSTIEIDLSNYKNNFLKLSIDELENLIIEDVSNKRWIYNDKAEKEIINLIRKNNLKHHKNNKYSKRRGDYNK